MPTNDYECQGCSTIFVAKVDPIASNQAMRCPACGSTAARPLPGLGGLGHHGHRRSGDHVHSDHDRRRAGLGLGCGRGGIR